MQSMSVKALIPKPLPAFAPSSWMTPPTTDLIVEITTILLNQYNAGGRCTFAPIPGPEVLCKRDSAKYLGIGL